MTSRGRLAALGVVLTIALAGCGGSEPTLLDPSDFEGDVTVMDRWSSGSDWCRALSPSHGEDRAWSILQFDTGPSVGATLTDGWSDRYSADAALDEAQAAGDRCVMSQGDRVGWIEPMTGLGADAVGWRIRRVSWTDFVMLKLDEWRVLTVWVSTMEDTAPVELDDLIRLAREGAEQFEPDVGDA